MKKVCIVRLLSTRMSIEMSITLMSHANSVMRLLAMRMKFWSMARRTMFRMTAKVTVVVAMMMHALLARKTVCTLLSGSVASYGSHEARHDETHDNLVQQDTDDAIEHYHAEEHQYDARVPL